MNVPRLWVSIRITAQATGRTEKALYEQIRNGTFPFVFRRAGSSILVSARDLGLITAANEEAQEGDQSLATATPAHA